MHRFVLIITFLTFVVPAHADDKITYDNQVIAVFREHCLGCHNAEKKTGGLDLSSYSALSLGSSTGEIVSGGNADASTLMKVVSHQQQPFMPPNKPRIPEAHIAILQKWIETGLLENAGSKAKVGKPRMSLALAAAPTGKPTEPIPLPTDALLDPPVHTARTSAVTAIDHNPWAPLVAIGGQKQILLYRTDNASLAGILPFPDGFANVLRFTRNGRYLLAAGGLGAQSGHAVLFDFESGRRLATVGDEYDAILAADITPEQSIVAIGGPDRLVKGIRVETGETIYTIKKHTDWVTALSFSPDGVLLASGDRNGGLMVWEAANGGQFYDLRGHKSAITAVSFRSDSNVLASCSEDGTIRLWNMQDGAEIKNWQHGSAVTDVRYAQDGRIISTGRNRSLTLWEGDGKAIRSFGPAPDIALRGVINEDGTRVLTADWTGRVRMQNVANEATIADLNVNPPTLAAQIDDLQKRMKTFAEKQSEWTQQLAAARDKQKQAGEAKDEAAAKAAAEQAANLERTIAEHAAAEPRLAQLKAAAAFTPVFYARQDLFAVQGTHDGKLAGVAAAKSEQQQLLVALEDTKKSVTDAPALIKQRETELADARSQSDAAQKAIEMAKAALAPVVEAAKAPNEVLNAKNAEVAAKLDVLNQAKADAQSKADAVKKSGEAAAAKLDAQQKTQASIGLKQMATSIVAASVPGKKSEIEKAVAAAKAKEAEVAAAKAAAQPKLDAAAKARADIQAKAAAAAKSLVDAKIRLEAAARAKADLADKAEALAKAKADPAAAATVPALEAEHASLTEFVGKLEAEHKALTDQAPKLEAERKGIEESLPKLDAEAKPLVDTFERLGREHAELAKRVEQLTGEEKQIEAAVALLNAEMEGMKQQVTNLGNERNALGEQIKKLQAEQQAAATVVTQREGEHKTAVDAAAAVKPAADAANQKVAAAQAEVEARQKAAAEMQARVAAAEKSLEEAKTAEKTGPDRVTAAEAAASQAADAVIAAEAAAKESDNSLASAQAKLEQLTAAWQVLKPK
jgi:hypothetical protein